MYRRIVGGSAVAALTLVAAAACTDLTAPEPVREDPGVARLQCRALVAELSVSCADDSGTGVQADRVLGGQGVYLRLTSSNVSYDSVAGVFGFDVTLQNLLVQRMGTDGEKVSGMRVFFSSGPTPTAGSGSVEVANPDGHDIFTASAQPYFFYAGTLGHREVTPAKRWLISVPPSVQSFGFTLYLSTPLLPVVVFQNSVAGNTDIYRAGIDGTDVTRLTTSPAQDENPTVAGNRVVFTSYRDGNAELYTVPLTGATTADPERRLTSTASLQETDPALSPDGTWLALSRGPTGGITRIYAARMDTLLTPTRLTFASAVAIESSPHWRSSTQLALMSTENGDADLWEAAVGGSSALLFGSRGAAEVEPTWSADGNRIAYASNSAGDTEVFLYDVAAATRTRLTSRTGSDGAPTWLRDGRIIFVCYSGSDRQLCMLDPAVPGSYTTLPLGTRVNNPWAVQF